MAGPASPAPDLMAHSAALSLKRSRQLFAGNYTVKPSGDAAARKLRMQLKVAAEYGPAAVAEVEAAEAEAAAARGEDVAQGGAAEQGASFMARCVRGVWGPLRARWGASRAETLHAALWGGLGHACKVSAREAPHRARNGPQTH